MGIGLTGDQRDLAGALADWASATGTSSITKDSENLGPKAFDPVWSGLTGLGVTGIAVADRSSPRPSRSGPAERVPASRGDMGLTARGGAETTSNLGSAAPSRSH